jgi:hypothetical protein
MFPVVTIARDHGAVGPTSPQLGDNVVASPIVDVIGHFR